MCLLEAARFQCQEKGSHRFDWYVKSRAPNFGAFFLATYSIGKISFNVKKYLCFAFLLYAQKKKLCQLIK